MDSLSLEMRREILRHLDLNDLARCGRVSHAVREGADEVLSTIRFIYHAEELENYYYHPWNKTFAFAILNSTPLETMFQADFIQENMPSFLRFITKKCPRVSSLLASDYFVCLKDIAALAPRLNYFSLDKIKKQSEREDTIDAKKMVAHFTNLQCYHVDNMDETGGCRLVEANEYSLLPSSQFAQCYEVCPKHEQCHGMVQHRAMKSLRLMAANLPLSLDELHPSSFNSLQFLHVHGSIVVPDNSPHFPNLLVAYIYSEHNLNSVIYLLRFSSRLLAARIFGLPDEESVPAIHGLLCVCSLLLYFVYCPQKNENLIDIPTYCFDFRRFESLRSFIWDAPDIPLVLILPPLCDQIVYGDDRVSFNFDEKKFAFSPKSIRRTRTFLHHLELVFNDHGLNTSIQAALTRLCPGMSLTLTFKSGDAGYKLVRFTLLFALEERNFTKITLVSDDKRETIYKFILQAFFKTLGYYLERPFSITLKGYILCPLEPIIKIHIKRKFTITRDDTKSPTETHVEISSSPDFATPDNNE